MKREFIILVSSFIIIIFLQYIKHFDIVCYLFGVVLGIATQYIKD